MTGSAATTFRPRGQSVRSGAEFEDEPGDIAEEIEAVVVAVVGRAATEADDDHLLRGDDDDHLPEIALGREPGDRARHHLQAGELAGAGPILELGENSFHTRVLADGRR